MTLGSNWLIAKRKPTTRLCREGTHLGIKKYQRPNDYIGIGQLGRLSLLFAEAIFKSSRSALYAFFVLNDTEHLTV
jgi:hypothetical protein